ncbi:TPA: hypothetical protein ACKP1B_000063 [Serratia fonticola]
MARPSQDLSDASPQFRQLWQVWQVWQQHDIHGRCQGQRTFLVTGANEVTFEHASFIVDEDNHLRLVMYSAQADCPASTAFETML